MKTKLISLAIALLSLAKLSLAQEPISTLTINPNIAPILQGSLLCGDEVIRKQATPLYLSKKWYVNTVVESDTNERKILITHYFKTPAESKPHVNQDGDTIFDIYLNLDTLITPLNKYLPQNINLHLNEANLSWDLKEQYYLDDTVYNPVVKYIIDIDMYNRKANPFQKCFTINNVCDKLQVVRHEVKPICPTYGVFTKYNIILNKEATYTVSNIGKIDTIYKVSAELSYVDSIAQYGVVCLAIGNTIKTDTIIFDNISYKSFESFVIKEKLTQIIYCVTTPCNPSEYNIVYDLGEVELLVCLPKGDSVDYYTGIEPELPISDVVYPNPTTEKLFVKGVTNVTLIDVLGNKSTLKGDGEFNIQGLKSGLYLLNYEINGENCSTKIVIQ